MSNFGNVTEITNNTNEEDTNMKRQDNFTEQAKGFFEEHGAKIALGASIIFALLTNRKVNALKEHTNKSFIRVAEVLNPLIDNVGNLYENTDILKNDIKTLAIHSGFQGKLNCDILSNN